MYLQGDLQAVFDALYEVGAIDPVLKMDWEQVTRDMEDHPEVLQQACLTVNACRGDVGMLVSKFQVMDPKTVQFVALEVAREFCEFQEHKELH